MVKNDKKTCLADEVELFIRYLFIFVVTFRHHSLQVVITQGGGL